MITYLVLLNTVILFDLLGSLTASYENGFGLMIALVPITWLYSLLCISSIVFYVLYLSFRKPKFILIGTLLHLVFTLLYHLIVESMTSSRSFTWGYLVIVIEIAVYSYFIRRSPERSS
ncbi:hypothetical protein BBD41_28755 [Paenibacillus ihbetae]|uniref:Uncharacterized protein n=1 Tax=Paenibacillus ihbetae TaxID=1870820 RepID=A0A1B2E8E4_9BACL|nr:hypothetical protein BBD41_28755 [Paenibacillus ihbetae]